MTTALRASLLVLLASAATTAQAVQFGWQELNGGGIEYIVQVEPELLDSFHDQGFTSDLPSSMRDVRSIRITVGKEKLPNENDLRGPAPKEQGQNAAAPASENRPNSAGRAANSNQSTGDRNATDGAAAKSAPAADQAFPPMSFLNLRGGRNGAGSNRPDANVAEKVADPQIKSDEGPHTGAAAEAADFRVVDANKPNITNSSSQTGGSSEATTPKPWWALMGAMLALFASLGANVYLVWIYQAVRAKYRALVQHSPLGGAAA